MRSIEKYLVSFYYLFYDSIIIFLSSKAKFNDYKKNPLLFLSLHLQYHYKYILGDGENNFWCSTQYTVPNRILTLYFEKKTCVTLILSIRLPMQHRFIGSAMQKFFEQKIFLGRDEKWNKHVSTCTTNEPVHKF